MYYRYDFETHKNLSHKQFPISVYYFMDYTVCVSFKGQASQSKNVRVTFSIILFHTKYGGDHQFRAKNKKSLTSKLSYFMDTFVLQVFRKFLNMKFLKLIWGNKILVVIFESRNYNMHEYKVELCSRILVALV